MKIRLKYFGIAAEIASRQVEIIDTESVFHTDDLHNILLAKYANFAGIKYKLAVNQKLYSMNTSLSENDEVAVLPPFAGG